jgi:hypothetical protein
LKESIRKLIRGANRLSGLALIWLGAWVLFAVTTYHGNTSHAFRVWGGELPLVGANFVLLGFVLINPRFGEMAPWELVTGLVMTFSALIGGYAAINFALSHSYMAIPAHVSHGKHIGSVVFDGKHGDPRVRLSDCYRDGSGPVTKGLARGTPSTRRSAR